MRKTWVIIILLIFSEVAFAQSKEETIKWITEKINLYGYYEHPGLFNCRNKNTTKSASNNIEQTTIVQCHDENDKVYKYTISFDNVCDIRELELTSELKVFSLKFCKGGDSFLLIIDYNKEYDLYNRMKKALYYS